MTYTVTNLIFVTLIFCINARPASSDRFLRSSNPDASSSNALSLKKNGGNIIPISIGVDYGEPFSDQNILRGFKQNIVQGESTFKPKVFEGEVFDYKYNPSYSMSTVINDVNTLREFMEIEGSLDVSYGPMIKGKASGKYVGDKMSNSKKTVFVYRSRHVAYAKAVNYDTLKPVRGIEGLKPDEIAETYGTKFVDAVMYGAQLDVEYTITDTDTTDLLDIGAELSGDITYGLLRLEFSAKFGMNNTETNSARSMEITVKASGVTLSTPPNPSFDQTEEIIKEFNTKYENLVDEVKDKTNLEDMTNVLQGIGPVAFSIASTADYIPNLNALETMVLDDRMSRLSDIFYSTFVLRDGLVSTRRAQEAIYNKNPKELVETFQPYDIAVTQLIDSLQDQKVEECLNYRRLPFSRIVGRDGNEPAPLPEEFPKSKEEHDIVNGLSGKMYISSPVKVDEITFDDLYYQGFAIPMFNESGSVKMKPWMSGELLRDSDDTRVAKARLPDELEKEAYAKINNIEQINHDYIRYNTSFFLQSNALDHLFLVSTNDEGNATTLSNFASVGQGSWVALSDDPDLGVIDSKDGDCVRYGDEIFLSLFLQEDDKKDEIEEKATSNHTLYVSSGKNIVKVSKRKNHRNRSRWTIIASITGNSVPECIQMNSKVKLQWIQNQLDPPKLLEANHLNTKIVTVGNELNDVSKHFQEWIVRSNSQSGKTSDGFNCGVISAKGKWVPISLPENNSTFNESKSVSIKEGNLTLTESDSISVEEDFNLTVGVIDRKLPVSSTWRQTTGWEDSVVKSISGGFQAVGHESDFEAEVSYLYGSMLASDAKNAIKKHFHSHFCWKQGRKNPGLKWSINGPINDYYNNMKCTHIVDPETSNMGNNNYLCVPQNSNLDFEWNDGGDNQKNNMECIKWTNERSLSGEGGWVHNGWNNNFLCASNTKTDDGEKFWWPEDFKISDSSEKTPEGYDCEKLSFADSEICWKHASSGRGDYGRHSKEENTSNGFECLEVEDEFYCAKSTGYPIWPDDFKWSETGVPHGYNCIEIEHGGSEKNETIKYTRGEGQIWQYEYEVKDMCVPSWTLKVKDTIVTASSEEQPCCLPGMELDKNVPHGRCRLGSPCLCDEEICERSLSDVYLPRIPTSEPGKEITFPQPSITPVSSSPAPSNNDKPKDSESPIEFVMTKLIQQVPLFFQTISLLLFFVWW